MKHAEIDERSRKNLIIKAEDDQSELRVRLKLFLNDQIEELLPTVQFEGVTLIR